MENNDNEIGLTDSTVTSELEGYSTQIESRETGLK